MPEEAVVEYPTTHAEAKRTARAVYYATQATESPHHRISKQTFVIFALIALVIDIIQALLVETVIGGTIISVAADTLFVILFWLRGVHIVGNPKRFFAMSAQAVIALIPVINVLPELTVGIIAVCLITRTEDSGSTLGQVAGFVQGKMAK